MKKQDIQAVLNKHGLTIESVFVPFSQSRNSADKIPSLNWLVTLKQNGKKILTTDYMAGCGHCPSYKQNDNSYDHNKIIMSECESGFKSKYTYSLSYMIVDKKNPILPDSVDVIYFLVMDSDVIEFDSFESWADDFGYDHDSRRAEKIYNDCMKIALQFRKIGESTIAELKDVYQDY